MLVVPTALVWRGEQPIVAFGELNGGDLSLPFWSQIVERARNIAIAPLDSLAPQGDGVRIAGCIFHMTRCGSTLAARQFSALPHTFAISEPFAFQHLLERPDPDLDRRARRLRTLLAAHAAALSPIADTLVIKWSSLMGLYAAEIERALPAVPSAFLHRPATEVLASIAAAPLGGRRHVRLEHLGRHAPPDLTACPSLEVSARAIAYICDQVALAESVRSLSYSELPQASWLRLAPHFGIAVGEQERAAMARAAKPHAKDPSRTATFAGDAWRGAELQASDVRRLAETLVDPSLRVCLQRLRPLGLTPDQSAVGGKREMRQARPASMEPADDSA